MKLIKVLCIAALLMAPFTAMADTAETPASATVASVNGVRLTQEQLDYFIANLGQTLAKEKALQEMINVELLVQAAAKQGLLQDQQLKLKLERNRSGLIASHFLQQHLRNLSLSEQQLKDRYQQVYLNNNGDFEYNANHILLEDEQSAKDVIKQLDQNADFSELAKKLSIGPSAKNGGELGWFKPTDMVPPFSLAMVKLEVGHYSSEPVKTQFGWHVIKLNERRKVEPPAYESVRKKLASAMASEAINALMQKLKSEASIEIK